MRLVPVTPTHRLYYRSEPYVQCKALLILALTRPIDIPTLEPLENSLSNNSETSQDKETIRCISIYNVKYRSQGTLNHYKARLVVKRYT